MEINWFDELFYSTEIWGYVGPLALVILGFVISAKNRVMGVFYYVILVIMVFTGYLNLDFVAHAWKVLIILVGGLAACLSPSANR